MNDEKRHDSRHCTDPECPDDACVYTRLLDRLHAYAQTLDQPPSRAQVADLYSHLATAKRFDGPRSGDPEAATRLVLDLGWRPAVGVEP